MRGTPRAAHIATVASLTRWKQKLRGITFATGPSRIGLPNPVLIGRTLLVSTFSPGAIFALDASTGAIRWRTDLGSYGGPAVLDCGPIIVAKTSQETFCLDRRTGGVRWSYCPYGRENEHIYSMPIRCGKNVLVADRGGYVRGFDLETGAFRFSVNAGRDAQVNSTPAYDGRTIYYSSNAGDVFALDPKSGVERWRRGVPGANTRKLLVLGTLLAVPTSSGVTFLRRSNGAVHAVWPGGGEVTSAVVTPHGLLATCRDERSTRLVALKSGKVTSERDLGEPAIDSLRYAPATGLVYNSRIMGFVIRDAATGAPQWELTGVADMTADAEVTRSSIYLLDMSGTVRALDHPRKNRT